MTHCWYSTCCQLSSSGPSLYPLKHLRTMHRTQLLLKRLRSHWWFLWRFFSDGLFLWRFLRRFSRGWSFLEEIFGSAPFCSLRNLLRRRFFRRGHLHRRRINHVFTRPGRSRRTFPGHAVSFSRSSHRVFGSGGSLKQFVYFEPTHSSTTTDIYQPLLSHHADQLVADVSAGVGTNNVVSNDVLNNQLPRNPLAILLIHDRIPDHVAVWGVVGCFPDGARLSCTPGTARMRFHNRRNHTVRYSGLQHNAESRFRYWYPVLKHNRKYRVRNKLL